MHSSSAVVPTGRPDSIRRGGIKREELEDCDHDHESDQDLQNDPDPECSDFED